MGPVIGMAVLRGGLGAVATRPLSDVALPLLLPTAAEADPRAPAPGGAPVAPSLAAFVAMAGPQLSPAGRRAAAKPVAEGLDLLQELHDEIAAGDPSEARLEALAGWARRLRSPDDPELASLLREVETRALVELAKWGR